MYWPSRRCIVAQFVESWWRSRVKIGTAVTTGSRRMQYNLTDIGGQSTLVRPGSVPSCHSTRRNPDHGHTILACRGDAPGARLELSGIRSVCPELSAWATSLTATSTTHRPRPTPATRRRTGAYFRAPRNADDQIGPAPPPDQVNRLADELGHHLKMNYKHDVPEYNRRYVAFSQRDGRMGQVAQGRRSAGADDAVAQDVAQVFDAGVGRFPAADAACESDRPG